MELDRLINYIEGNLENQYPKNIIVSEFTFNGVICKNVDFVFMGISKSKENLGKAIYMSKDCLPKVQVSMDSLLAGSDNKDVGTGEIGAAATKSLDSAIYDITKKHLKEYTREYDGSVHTEKIFFPLECEVFGGLFYSKDKATLDKYPQWEGFRESEDLIRKSIIYKQEKLEVWMWWEANMSRGSGGSGWFCGVYYGGSAGDGKSNYIDRGAVVAFCL